MTTQPFKRPGPIARPPALEGGKIAIDPPIPAPIPPPRSVWGIVLPIALIVGVVGFIIAMYVSGMRSFASGFGIFGIMMLIGMAGMLFRGRGAAQKMSWGELRQYRANYFARQDEVRDEIGVQRRAQFERREHFHWDPGRLVAAVGTERMWERTPGSDPSTDVFGEVRVGIGKVKLAMQIEKPKIPEASQIEPATGHALRKFLLEQEYIDDMAKVIWLPRFAGVSIVGDMDRVRSLVRAMMCQLAAFHSPSDLQLLVVSDAPAVWDWAKWLPHMQHPSKRDGCGERRLLFSSPARLEEFLDEAEMQRSEWTPPTSGLHGAGSVTALPFRVIIDDHCGTPEDWAGLTGSAGYAGTCFVRLAPSVPSSPQDAFGSKSWVGFSPETTYRLVDGALRKTLPPEDLTAHGGVQHLSSDELDDVFYAQADQMTVAAAERFARAMARHRAGGALTVTVSESNPQRRTLLDALSVRDPRNLDVDRLWSPRRSQGPDWMRFPVGLDESGQVVELDLKEGSQQGMGMHSLFIGTTGAGKSEGIITEVASMALTHSPEVANVVFFDFKLKSAAGVLDQFPHVVASVSNLGDERHLVGRMYEALEGELDRRGALCNAAGPDVVDLTVYNQRRLTDPSLPPVPVLWVIADEYQELLNDTDWGDKFRSLFWRIMRQGRAYHMFLQLVGQTVDTQKLRDIRKLLGFTIAGRTGTEEDSREAIGSTIAAKIDEKGAEGTAYLRVAQRQPRQFRFFYSSADFVPQTGPDESRAVEAGTWFEPRPFTAEQARDIDGLLAEPVEHDTATPAPAAEASVKIVDAVIGSLQATGAAPPRQLWLPPLGEPPAADDLVARLRGKPWDVDYGNNPGLVLPVALEDRPREHRQDVCYLNMLESNALVIGAPRTGHTTAVMTMITAGALMYRPERVQFYCIAGSGPQLASLNDLPHVAGVAALHDTEGVSRLLATVRNIVDERERLFAARGLDMNQVREAKFGPNPSDIGVPGGDVIVVVDGWANFSDAFPKQVEQFNYLMRAGNYGVRTIVTHTSYLSKIGTPVKNLSTERIELRMTDVRESELGRRDPTVNRGKEVPVTPGHGLSAAGFHIMVGEPALANGPTGRIDVRGVGAVVRQVAGVEKFAEVKRLPQKVTLAEVLYQLNGGSQRDLVPFGLSEADLGPAFIDFAENPHVVVVGRAQSGRSAFLRTMMHSIMAHYTPDEATIALIDPRRRHLGVVPEDTWLSRYAYTRGDIALAADELAQLFDKRTPPPGTSPSEMLSRQFWTGRKIFLVIDDITSWTSAENPLSKLSAYVEQADQLGLHIIAAADIKMWSFQSAGSSVLGRIVGGLQPTIILDGRRENGPIISGVYAEPQRQGKGIFVQPGGTDGVLVAWTPEPARLTPGRHSTITPNP
ncbi:type VII secretion protein EccCa [Mycobacterium lehmannii]|uniref:type VII secretion protein EccCa n=1 Tax=Mycobacterium lehmannii TaxID=2048550 RepID=UPI000B944044|nr:type VII secretion protein EccCa [Mycobacterium lehmannii]